MRYTIGKLQFTSVTGYREPYLQLPGKAAEVLEGYYKALHPRYRIDLKDLQSLGGTSFGDLKVVISALGGRARVEVTPAVMITEYRDVDDLAAIRDFLVVAESTLQAKLPGVLLQQRAIRAAGWLKIDEGSPAVERMLQERGDAAFKLQDGTFKDWTRNYTLEVGLDDQKGKRLSMLLERSNVPEHGELFARCDYAQADLGEGLSSAEEAFDGAFKYFELLLKHADLEPKAE